MASAELEKLRKELKPFSLDGDAAAALAIQLFGKNTAGSNLKCVQQLDSYDDRNYLLVDQGQ